MVQTKPGRHVKKTISPKFILSSAILACVLIGNYSLDSSNAQDIPTDLISTSPDNASTAGALPAKVDPNSALAQVIQLVQAGVEQSVIRPETPTNGRCGGRTRNATG
jgi:hypothetical protein